jgi:5-methylcytosine-specific restriction endonuclease McrA
MSARGEGRTDRQWRKIRAQVLAEESVCWLCGNWIDQRLSGRHPLGPTVDHVDFNRRNCARWNLRAAHHSCNSSRGNGTRPSKLNPSLDPFNRSRVW